jgi:hypothetical protein
MLAARSSFPQLISIMQVEAGRRGPTTVRTFFSRRRRKVDGELLPLLFFDF